MVEHVTASTAALLETLPPWATLVRAANPGPMTLDGTNTWILRAPDSRRCVVIDPGPQLDAHLAAVAELGPVEAVLVTHGHPDHTDGVPKFCRLTGAQVIDFDGERELAGLRIRAVETPGHTRDSVCFVVNDEAVLTGDTILGRGTTIIADPDGALGPYLHSLGRLRALGAPGPTTVLPGHGPVLPDLAAICAEYLAHRAERLEQVRAALRDLGDDASTESVTDVVYVDTDASVRGAAEASVRAQLKYLREGV